MYFKVHTMIAKETSTVQQTFPTPSPLLQMGECEDERRSKSDERKSTFIQVQTVGPLLFVLDEAPLQHKILHFGLFQAKTYANGL